MIKPWNSYLWVLSYFGPNLKYLDPISSKSAVDEKPIFFSPHRLCSPPPHWRHSHRVWILSPPCRPYWPNRFDRGVSPSFTVTIITLFFSSISSTSSFLLLSPPCVQLERGIIILTGLTGRGRRAGTWIVTCVKGRAGRRRGCLDISVCLIVALILWQWHAVNSDSESQKPPGPINAQELVCWHFYTDILTSNNGTVQTEPGILSAGHWIIVWHKRRGFIYMKGISGVVWRHIILQLILKSM